jgi:hypothetical protein
LERDVRFVGFGRHASIWDRTVCDRMDKDDEPVFDDAVLLASLK